jgi:hypothetical protein
MTLGRIPKTMQLSSQTNPYAPTQEIIRTVFTKLATRYSSEPDESNPHHHALFIENVLY